MLALILILFLFAPRAFTSKIGAAEDRSLPADNYREAGLPACNRPWTPQDYERAAHALAMLAQQNPLWLPRFESVRSGAVFSRIIAQENLAVLGDDSLSAKARLAVFWPILLATTHIFELYESRTYQHICFDIEAVELFAFMLRQIPICFKLVDELGQAPEDEIALVAHRIIIEITQGYVQSFVDAIVLSTEKGFYRKQSRKKMLAYVREILPEVITRFPAPAQRELIKMLDQAKP